MFAMFSFMLTISAAFLSVFGQVYDFTDINKCSGTYTCPDEADCYITCTGTYSCGVASNSNQCIINCPDNADCIIEANGAYAMQFADVYGGNGGNVYVNCIGNFGCRDLAVFDTENGKIEVTAIGAYNQIVYGIDLYGEDAAFVSLTVEGNNNASMIGYGRIYCPETYSVGEKNCVVNLQGTASQSLLQARFYSVGSFENLDLSCDAPDCTGATMYCGVGYSTTCSVQLIEGTDIWGCTDTASACQLGGASLVEFDDVNQCSGTYFCPSSGDCYVNCIGTYACGSSSGNGCAIYCPRDNDCVINSNGEYAAKQALLYGGANGNLRLDCSGDYACHDMRIYAPSNGDAVVTATGDGDQTLCSFYFYGQNSNSLTVNANVSGGIANSEIYCPYSFESGSQNNCIINVEGTNNLLSNTRFYAVESFTDLYLSCNGDCDGADMYCTSTYSESCDMELIAGTDVWGCVDDTDICHDFTFSPTASPTPPTTSPTDKPTIPDGASLVEFDDVNQCSDVYFCPRGVDCYVNCIGTYACGSSSSIACHIYCPKDNDCVINSNGEYAAQYMVLYGGANGNLRADCSGDYACRYMRMYAPSNGDAVVTASGDGNQILYNFYFYGQNSNSLTVNADVSGGIAGSRIYCPYSFQSGSQNNCIINVEGTNSLLSSTRFFAVESFTDLYLSCIGDCDGAYMHCTSTYSESCDMKLIAGTDVWGCVDDTDICHDLTFAPTTSPTDKPTGSPTDQPTASPTYMPSESPTNKPTTSPTEKPSNSPTDKPSASPTERPTFSPSEKPTTSPTERPTGSPSDKPTASPSGKPTTSPTGEPTDLPSDNPTPSPTLAPVYVSLCENEPCDCVNEDPYCLFCQQPANICGQCQYGYFRLNDNTPCQACQDVFGTQCLFCQSGNGCGQCANGYTRTYDSQENLYYCKENTHKPSQSPSLKPSNNPTVAQVTGTGGPGPCVDVSNTISHCSEDENCINCQPWGGCTQCANGHWIFAYDYRCQDCSNIENCTSCNPWVGCSTCEFGYHIVWNTQCSTSKGGTKTIATCEANKA